MTLPLDLERFRMLADAYGGNILRWPIEQQEAAADLATRSDARAILQEASRLDHALDVWAVRGPSETLIEQSLRSGYRLKTLATRRLRFWWAGIGFAAALTGAVAGSLGAASISSNDPSNYSSTLFGDIPDQED